MLIPQHYATMASTRQRTIFWIFVFLAAVFLDQVFSTSSEPPTNISYVISKSNCMVEILCKWEKPNSSISIENYVISYYATRTFNGSVAIGTRRTLQMANNRTEQIISISGNYTTIHLNISANYSTGNTYQLGPPAQTVVTKMVQTDCTPSTSKGDDDKDGMMYVVKLASIIVSSAVGIIIIFFVSFRLCVWRMERRYHQKDLATNDKSKRQLLLVDHHLPISIDNFYDHVSSMKFSDNRGFKTEFAQAEDTSSQGCAFGNRPYNMPKNRYANVPTYDKTRVILEEEQGKPSATYINANYVDGLAWPKAYIATQAPLPETISDFWRMIWEKEINCIVMIVNLKEKDGAACTRYWPEDGSITYGKVTVRSLEVNQCADYVIRSFEIRSRNSMELRLVRQFHYTSWPASRNVPVHPTAFLEFVKNVASFRVNNMQPVVVHCSSGNGRTGVYIIVDSQLNRIEHQEDVNIFYNLDFIRGQRFKIIRNLEEYIFIHECILDHLTFKNRFDIDGRNLADYLACRKETEAKDGEGLHYEFADVTTDITQMNNRADVAKIPQNTSKNRFENILPFDHARVRLKKKSALDGSDYINASYFDSCRHKKSYIITQSPMEGTVFDFWCMIWENVCLTIIMLSHADENLLSYWPETNEVLKAGKIEVRVISVEKLKHFVIRHLEIKHAEHLDVRLVRQYQYDTWPDKSCQESITQLVDFVAQCTQWNATSRSKTMTVHCRAGTGKSGVFVAICQLIEKLNSDGAINVVQTVRKLRQNRMAVIQTLNHYELIYHAMAIYFKTHYLRRNDRDAQTQTDLDSATASSIFNTSFASGGNESFSEGNS